MGAIAPLPHRFLGLLLVRPEHAANVLSILADLSELGRNDISARYTVVVAGPADCVSPMIQQAVADFQDEHIHHGHGDATAARVRFIAELQKCTSSASPDALPRAAHACVVRAAVDGADELLLVHASMRLLYSELSACALWEAMCAADVSDKTYAGVTVGDFGEHEQHPWSHAAYGVAAAKHGSGSGVGARPAQTSGSQSSASTTRSQSPHVRPAPQQSPVGHQRRPSRSCSGCASVKLMQSVLVGHARSLGACYGAPIAIVGQDVVRSIAALLQQHALPATANAYTLPAMLTLYAVAASHPVRVAHVPHSRSLRITVEEARSMGDDPLAYIGQLESAAVQCSACSAAAASIPSPLPSITVSASAAAADKEPCGRSQSVVVRGRQLRRSLRESSAAVPARPYHQQQQQRHQYRHQLSQPSSAFDDVTNTASTTSGQYHAAAACRTASLERGKPLRRRSESFIATRLSVRGKMSGSGSAEAFAASAAAGSSTSLTGAAGSNMGLPPLVATPRGKTQAVVSDDSSAKCFGDPAVAMSCKGHSVAAALLGHGPGASLLSTLANSSSLLGVVAPVADGY